MTNRIMEQTESEGGAMDETEPLTPLDSWLRRELQAYYGGAKGDQLPPELAKLASRLEEKLRNAESGAGSDDPPQRDRTPPGKGRNR